MQKILQKLANLTPESTYSERPYTWRASSLDKCYRLQLLEALGYRTIPTPDQLLMMRMGQELHKILQDAIVKEFPGAQVEIRVDNPQLDIGGKIDVLIPLRKPVKNKK